MQKVLFSGGDLYEISQTISIDSSNFFYWRIASRSAAAASSSQCIWICNPIYRSVKRRY